MDECVIIVVIFEVMDDPLIDCFDLIFVGFTASTNFVSKVFRLCVPQGCATVGEIRGIRFADEIVCGDPGDQNVAGDYQNANFRQQLSFTNLICRGNEIHELGDEKKHCHNREQPTAAYEIEQVYENIEN